MNVWAQDANRWGKWLKVVINFIVWANNDEGRNENESGFDWVLAGVLVVPSKANSETKEYHPEPKERIDDREADVPKESWLHQNCDRSHAW